MLIATHEERAVIVRVLGDIIVINLHHRLGDFVFALSGNTKDSARHKHKCYKH